jgi:RNA-binding protein FUS
MTYNPNTMSFDLPDTDTVYVSGMPAGVSEGDIAEFFGSIGIIKLDKKTKSKKIYLYRDKATGELKGDCTVTYEDPFSAASAVEWFHNKDWKGARWIAGSPPGCGRRAAVYGAAAACGGAL